GRDRPGPRPGARRLRGAGDRRRRATPRRRGTRHRPPTRRRSSHSRGTRPARIRRQRARIAVHEMRPGRVTGRRALGDAAGRGDPRCTDRARVRVLARAGSERRASGCRPRAARCGRAGTRRGRDARARERARVQRRHERGSARRARRRRLAAPGSHLGPRQCRNARSVRVRAPRRARGHPGARRARARQGRQRLAGVDAHRRRHRRLRRDAPLPRRDRVRRLRLVRDALPAGWERRARDAGLRRGAPGARRVTLRYGIFGAGVVVPMHLEGIAALDDVELVGISAPGDAHALAEGAGTQAFTDNAELLAHGLDVAVICTPHPFHPALTIEALAAGAHVLVEKPLAVEVRDADAMIAAADDAGRLLGVCFQQRFRPVVAAARELVAAGRLGDLIRVSIVDPLYRPNSYYGTAGWRGTWRGEGGGVLMNQAPHTLDLLCHLAGPPATAWGKAWRRSQPMEAEDTATALLEFPGGGVGTLAVSTTEPGVQ